MKGRGPGSKIRLGPTPLVDRECKRSEMNSILIVDDDMEILRLLVTFLSGNGYLCETATSAEAAL